MKFCCFSVSAVNFDFSFPRGAQTAAVGKRQGQQGCLPTASPQSHTTLPSREQELICILCVSAVSSLWTFPIPSAPSDGKRSSPGADHVCFLQHQGSALVSQHCQGAAEVVPGTLASQARIRWIPSPGSCFPSIPKHWLEERVFAVMQRLCGSAAGPGDAAASPLEQSFYLLFLGKVKI